MGEEGGVSGEKGLEGLGARAHRGWASPLGEHVGLEEASAGTQGYPFQRGGRMALATLLTQKKCAAPEAC